MRSSMSNEEGFLARVEAADPDTFAQILVRATPEEERILRVYFGEPKYQEMRRLAVQQEYGPASTRSIFGDLFGSGDEPAAEPAGNVVVLPGLMGSELTVYRRDEGDRVWLSYWRIFRGRLGELRLTPDGSEPSDPTLEVRPTGVLKDYYGEQLLSLRRHWNVATYPYDWRKTLSEAADGLASLIRRKFGSGTPVHLVTHSMGGLVARVFIRRHQDLWQRMQDPHAPERGGRLIMLGTPNYGSHLAVQALTGLAGTVRKLELLDTHHDLQEVLQILSTFPGLYHLLPSQEKSGARSARLYQASTYHRVNPYVRQTLLDVAAEQHRELAEIVDPGRMIYIAGYAQATISGIVDYDHLDDPASYEATSTQGDGTVTHRLGLLKEVRTYFVKEAHEDLPASRRVRDAVNDLLRTGKTDRLSGGQVARRGPATQPGLALEIQQARERELGRLHDLMGRTRGLSRVDAERATPPIGEARRQAERLLVKEFLGTGSESDPGYDRRVGEERARPTPVVEIRVEFGKIQDPENMLDADAIAVGHYLGVRPSGSERELDLAISGVSKEQAVSDDRLILTQYAGRGIIRGHLGQPFFLPDPRRSDRLIAIAGMGPAGRCGLPELTVLVRELCWSLGEVGKQHLASVLIGSGAGNLAVREAVDCWLDGLSQALADRSHGAGLTVLTFVEHDPRRVLEIIEALERAHQRGWVRLHFDPPTITEAKRQQLLQVEVERYQAFLREQSARPDDDQVPVRVTVEVERDPSDPTDPYSGTYLFSLLTRTASVPTRAIPLDLRLVDAANNELAAAMVPERQVELGRYLEELLVPDDLRGKFASPAPLVIQLDSTTARIHWELLAQPGPVNQSGNTVGNLDHNLQPFLGLNRGLTRQLRAGFAPPPEPPPPPSRTLRVLIVADPAGDMPLAGAEQEGYFLTELIESYNRVGRGQDDTPRNRVQVTALIGPTQATRTAVHRELLLNRYDVFHFAGHCIYEKERPERSGLIFSRTERLTARELNRIDRVPSLIFCNACESGVTPDRTGERSAELAPVFAEAFFARGVSNFICTAWPVGDRSALKFAAILYSRLLGLEWDEEGHTLKEVAPSPMYQAMRDARRSLAGGLRGTATWGAYQHYGSPYYRFFAVHGG